VRVPVEGTIFSQKNRGQIYSSNPLFLSMVAGLVFESRTFGL
jgi:hypothetical protein